MSPYAGMLLVNEILPRLRAAIPHTVRPVGAEDYAELIQDAAAIASAALHSAEARQHRVLGHPDAAGRTQVRIRWPDGRPLPSRAAGRHGDRGVVGRAR